MTKSASKTLTAANNEAATITLTTRCLANLLGLTVARVSQLEAERVLAPEARNRWNAQNAIRSYIGHLKHNRTEAADLRLRQARADEIEVRNARNSKALIVEAQREALAVVDEMTGLINAGLSAIPAKITTDLVLRRNIEIAIDAVCSDVATRSSFIAGELTSNAPYQPDTED